MDHLPVMFIGLQVGRTQNWVLLIHIEDSKLSIVTFHCLSSYFGPNLMQDSSMKDFMFLVVTWNVTPRTTDFYVV